MSGCAGGNVNGLRRRDVWMLGPQLEVFVMDRELQPVWGRCVTWVSSEAPGMFSTSCMQIDVVFQMFLSPRTLSLEARSPITRFYL